MRRVAYSKSFWELVTPELILIIIILAVALTSYLKV